MCNNYLLILVRYFFKYNHSLVCLYLVVDVSSVFILFNLSDVIQLSFNCHSVVIREYTIEWPLFDYCLTIVWLLFDYCSMFYIFLFFCSLFKKVFSFEFIVHCRLLTADCLLFTVHCSLRNTNYTNLRIKYCSLFKKVYSL